LPRRHPHRPPSICGKAGGQLQWPRCICDVQATLCSGGAARQPGADGAVIKHIACEPRLLKHTGPAVVFDDYADLQQRINDPALNITPDSVLVLRNAGPKGGAGMPEYGMLPIPDYLLAQGSGTWCASPAPG
jgi:Dehydratase family